MKRESKSLKGNNKGFSLVELIVVMAIMAILVGAVAVSVIKYVEKAKESKDEQVVATVFTAVQTTIADTETQPAGIFNDTFDAFIATGVYPDTISLLDADMISGTFIKAKCVSKKGKNNTPYVYYDPTTGFIAVYIAASKATEPAIITVANEDAAVNDAVGTTGIGAATNN